MMAAREIYPRFLTNLVRFYAVSGGAMLILAALITVISVLKRALGADAVSGDFELVELATAIAVFAFLPWGHMTGDHVRVDILASRFGPRMFHRLGTLSDALVLLVSGVILWRLYLGFAEKFPYGDDGFRTALSMGAKPFFPETTYELQIPIWMPYGFCLIGATLFFMVAWFRLVADIKGKIT